MRNRRFSPSASSAVQCRGSAVPKSTTALVILLILLDPVPWCRGAAVKTISRAAHASLGVFPRAVLRTGGGHAPSSSAAVRSPLSLFINVEQKGHGTPRHHGTAPNKNNGLTSAVVDFDHGTARHCHGTKTHSWGAVAPPVQRFAAHPAAADPSTNSIQSSKGATTMIRESVFETYGSPTSPEQKLWLDAAEREHIELEKDRLANPKSASGYRYKILNGESARHFLLSSPPPLRYATAHMRPQRLAVVFFEVRSDRDTYVLTFLPLFDPPALVIDAIKNQNKLRAKVPPFLVTYIAALHGEGRFEDAARTVCPIIDHDPGYLTQTMLGRVRSQMARSA